jgi:hypothetical protein
VARHHGVPSPARPATTVLVAGGADADAGPALSDRTLAALHPQSDAARRGVGPRRTHPARRCGGRGCVAEHRSVCELRRRAQRIAWHTGACERWLVPDSHSAHDVTHRAGQDHGRRRKSPERPVERQEGGAQGKGELRNDNGEGSGGKVTGGGQAQRARSTASALTSAVRVVTSATRA